MAGNRADGAGDIEDLGGSEFGREGREDAGASHGKLNVAEIHKRMPAEVDAIGLDCGDRACGIDGGTAAPRPDDAHLVAGEMAGMAVVQGDASINSACTVTAVQADRVYLCGHPLMNLGNVQLPMARTRVLTTLSSELASTKIVNVGGSIGTITGDHLTVVTGQLGAPPPMIPLDLTLLVSGAAPSKEKTLHFELVNHPKLTPLLVAITTFNGLTQNSLYGEGTTLHLSGEIRLQGHAPVQIENTFAPGDSLSPDGMPIALTMQNVFTRLFVNTFEPAKVDRITLRVDSVPGRKSFTIESAWLEKGEAAPGETLRVRVLLPPYPGTAQPMTEQFSPLAGRPFPGLTLLNFKSPEHLSLHILHAKQVFFPSPLFPPPPPHVLKFFPFSSFLSPPPPSPPLPAHPRRWR